MRVAATSRQTVWIAILASSPLAYVGSIWLESRLPSQTVIPPFTREQAIQTAVRFAESRHIDTRGWRADVGVTKDDKNNELAVVLRSVQAPALEQIATPVPLAVLLRSPDSSRWFRAHVTPQGRVVSFQENDPPERGAVDEPAAAVIARQFLMECLGANSGFVLEHEKIRVTNEKAQRREVTWTSRVPGLAEAEGRFFVRLVGNRVVEEGSSVTFGHDYLKRFRPHRAWIIGFQIAAALYFAILGIYALIRYIGRATEKEVSHRRTLLLALLCMVLTCTVVFADPGGVMAAEQGNPQGTGFVIMLAVLSAIGMALVGMFFGVAYGAGEGALRESYPAKLTSLDALLSGRLFSANVARSILTGGGMAGWIGLMQVAGWMAAGAFRARADLKVLTSVVQPLPLLNLTVDVGSDALMLMSFGLLLPLALLRPRLRKPWLFFALLPVFSIVCASLSAPSESLPVFAVSLVALGAATLLPFFFGDLLASTACIFALQFVRALAERSLISEHWLMMTLYVAAGALAFLIAQVYFARYGRTYREWEVRPRYAKFVAEHLAMQAEIGAARQVQLRLLPDAPPRIAGLSIAGSCIPSREVSGDFYDYFGLDEHRLGIFLAEGGSRELGSAMAIALAKGYLLYSARLDVGPAEILRRLRDTLGAAIHAQSGVSMLYAVIDTSARTLRFARTGDSPRIVINGNAAAEEIAAAQGEGMAIRHGAASLVPNDAVVFYTDGFAAQIARQQRQPADRFLTRTLTAIRAGSALDVHSAIMEAALRRKNEQPPDDVTAVVIRLERATGRAMEVVA